MGRAGSRSAGPLPRQSRPYVLANPSSALRKTDDDEDDDRLPFKMACGSFFAWHLKNACGHVVYPPVCARKKTIDRRSLYEDEEDKDSSSGTDIIDEVILLCCSLSLILSPKPKSQIYLTEKEDQNTISMGFFPAMCLDGGFFPAICTKSN